MVGAVELSVAFTNMVDLYLDSPNEDNICKLALTRDKEGVLNGYAREALRLDPPFKGVYRTVLSNQTADGLAIQKDGQVFLDILAAGRNVVQPHYHTLLQYSYLYSQAQVFPEPETVNACRDQSGKKYIISDGNISAFCLSSSFLINSRYCRCLGEDITVQIMSQVLRGVFAIIRAQ
ncbi:hypothetical protein BT96DRAFT_1066438 [Gymnopus androsaceus JB14]|uniref:Uncharacterized protein n=1 Tax=Gymnopus androsaceus JB14 TaxID=1447944 RepID=A0A6A4GY19_9AGAR|nr:hypothetical protein BT96DRAFT_1066438 [Gymnopus androsaceus JB14]